MNEQLTKPSSRGEIPHELMHNKFLFFCLCRGVVKTKQKPSAYAMDAAHVMSVFLKSMGPSSDTPVPRKLKNPEANEIPDCVVEAWNKAVEENSKTAKTALFNTWMRAGKNFSMLLDIQRLIEFST